MRATIVSLLVLGCTAVAHATDRPISGAKLVLTRSPSGVEKLTFLSKDPGFLFPAIGGASDPSVAGASVRVVSPFDAATLTLPPGAETPDGASRTPRSTRTPTPTAPRRAVHRRCDRPSCGSVAASRSSAARRDSRSRRRRARSVSVS